VDFGGKGEGFTSFQGSGDKYAGQIRSKLLEKCELQETMHVEQESYNKEKALKAILDGLLNLSELKFLMVLQLSFMLEEIEEIQEIGRILLVSSNSEPH
jgi:hypothetical protein